MQFNNTLIVIALAFGSAHAALYVQCHCNSKNGNDATLTQFTCPEFASTGAKLSGTNCVCPGNKPCLDQGAFHVTCLAQSQGYGGTGQGLCN